jgi:hypothetical protein
MLQGKCQMSRLDPDPSPDPSVVMATCVRNEARFLPAFLAYYRALGVERAYVFLDRCTDASREILKRHDWVEAVEVDQEPGPTQLTVHQMRCADEALARARAEGYDWLLFVDVDEYAWGGHELPPARPWWRRASERSVEALLREGSLRRLVAQANAATEMVVLKTAEVVPEADHVEKPFWTLRHVQVKHVLPRRMLDPTTGALRVLDRWIGHRLGKSLVRTAADVQAFDSHVWTRFQGVPVPERLPIRTEERGWLLHYVVTDGRHWLNKYRQLAQEPDHWLRGQVVEFPKQAWKEASLTMDEAAARAYFDRWVAVSRSARWKARARGHIKRISFVEDVMQRVLAGEEWA